jgi:hypothetical protein
METLQKVLTEHPFAHGLEERHLTRFSPECAANVGSNLVR